jgi:hypothetical protein
MIAVIIIPGSDIACLTFRSVTRSNWTFAAAATACKRFQRGWPIANSVMEALPGLSVRTGIHVELSDHFWLG